MHIYRLPFFLKKINLTYSVLLLRGNVSQYIPEANGVWLPRELATLVKLLKTNFSLAVSFSTLWCPALSTVFYSKQNRVTLLFPIHTLSVYVR